MTYVFDYKHFAHGDDGGLKFQPNVNPFDYQINQLILESERNIGALARLGLKNHPLKPTILRNSLVRTAHFTTKIEQNKLDLKEVEQVFYNYKHRPLTIKEKAQLEVRNVFTTYEFLYELNPKDDFSDMDEPILKKLQENLMRELTGHPIGYRGIPVALQPGFPPKHNEVTTRNAQNL